MKTRTPAAFVAALLLTVTLAIPTHAAVTDSLVIRFANQTRMVIYAPSKAGIQALTAYDLNKIVRDMGLKLDSLPNGQTAIRLDEQQGERYLKDTVLIVTRSRGNVNVVIREPGRYYPDTTGGAMRNARNVMRAVRDTIRTKRSHDRLNPFFDIQLGIDGWESQSANATYASGSYDLRPYGSRYFGLAIGARPVLAGNNRVKLSLYYAIEGIWQNYMFENNVIARKGPTQILFAAAGEPLEKSKLTNFSLQLPIVPRVTFYSATGRRAFYLGVGGFVGYRLDSYTRTLSATGSNNREYTNFYQNNLRYGLVAHVGILKLDLFAKYELSPVFQTGRGPDLRSFSFGITL